MFIFLWSNLNTVFFALNERISNIEHDMTYHYIVELCIEQTDPKEFSPISSFDQTKRPKIFRGFNVVVVVPSCSTSSSTWLMYDPISHFFPVLSSLKISLLGRHKHFKFFVCMTESKWYVSHEETCHVIWCHLPESQPLRCFKVEKKMRGLEKETLSLVATT